VIHVPEDFTVEASSKYGVRVHFRAVAEDDVDGFFPAECTPPSGTVFRLGTTVVTCSATDSAGNTGSATFTITVVKPESSPATPLLQSLLAEVKAADIHPVTKLRLAFHLKLALHALPWHPWSACVQVHRFIAVIAWDAGTPLERIFGLPASRTLPAELAEQWLEQAREIKRVLPCR
jgi:hypothetical protein